MSLFVSYEVNPEWESRAPVKGSSVKSAGTQGPAGSPLLDSQGIAQSFWPQMASGTPHIGSRKPEGWESKPGMPIPFLYFLEILGLLGQNSLHGHTKKDAGTFCWWIPTATLYLR